MSYFGEARKWLEDRRENNVAYVQRADVAGFVPTIIVKEFLRYTMPALQAASRVTRADRFAGAANFGDTIQVPTHLTRLGTTQLLTGIDSQGAEADPVSVTFTAPTTGNVQLLISQWWYSAFQLGVYATHLANQDLGNILEQSARDSLAVKIDSTLTDEFDTFTTVVGTDNVPLTDGDVREANEDLDTVDVPEEDRSLFISAKEKNTFLGIEKYNSSLFVGSITPTIRGQLGNSLYGTPVLVTNNLKAGSSGKIMAMMHRSAMAMAMRQDVEPFMMRNPNTLADEVAFYAIWGKKVLRDNHGIEIDSR